MRLLVALVALLLAPAAFAATHTVRNTDAEGEGSLAQALADAEKGDVILFGSAVRGTIELEEPLDIDTDLTIKGPGADAVTVRGAGEVTLSAGGTVSISGLTIAGGETALKLRRGRMTLLDSAVRDSRGTGINAGDAKLTFSRTLIAGNAGPGVESEDGAIVCLNSTVADNGGAGLRSEDGDLELANCTIADNRGAGIEVGEGKATLRNTLLVRNLRACSGSVASQGHNLVDDSSCAFSGAGDVQSDDPRLGSLARNGGPTETMAPTGGSPAIDGGNPTGCADPAGDGMLTVDQRGMRRPAGSSCDIGAFETPAAVTGTVVNRIVALVDGDPITSYEVRKFAADDPRIGQSGASASDVLEIVITKKVLEKEIEAQGIKVTDVDIDRYIANVRQRNNINEDQLDAALAQQGLTRARYRQQIKEELERAQLINKEIRGKVSVSPEEIERYQKAQGGGSGSGTPAAEDEAAPTPKAAAASGDDEEITISHIVLQIPAGASDEQVAAVEARADKIYEELEDGADFATVAQRESEDGAAKAGGKLGTFKKSEIKDELAGAVEGLEPGEFSKPVRMARAIHIVRLDERVTAKGKDGTEEVEEVAETEKVEVTDTAREEIKEKLYAEALEERYNRWIREDLRKRHSVEMRP
ncbi:MAG: choice-of-anchor Q domain-containing protein [Deltaproteobacteria bacterium]|nr:choice-of-anchor Q domain-containing protein [Deltaproteobacteria bacterium]